MRLVVFDLVGDASWRAAARLHDGECVQVDHRLYSAAESSDVIVVDGRGAFERGLTLTSWLHALGGRAKRVLVTERELPVEHQLAYGAGATRVVVMRLGQPDHASVLAELAAEGKP